MKFLSFCIGLLLLSPILKAQDDTDFQLWMNYALTIPINSNLSYGGDAGLRGLISNDEWNQFLIRPTITYRWNQTFSVAGAVAWFSTYNVDDFNVNEFRIHQDFNVSWPDISILEFFWRVRLEQRWFFYADPDLENDFKVRGRLLGGFETADIRFGEGKRPIYFQAILEGFQTFGDEEAVEFFVNSTRIHAAFGHRISDAFRYELHYIWQKSRLGDEDGLRTTENIFRIRVFHRLEKKSED